MATVKTPVINDQLDKMNGILSMLVEEKIEKMTDWDKVGEIVRKGLASDFYEIGDQFVTEWTDTAANVKYTVPLDVVHFGTAMISSGEEVPAMYLQWHYSTPFGVVFDAPEPDNADTNIQQYGYNRWSQSAVRQWLNSSKAKGSWWTAQSDTDVAPDMATTKDGFMKGFSSDFLAQLKPVKVITQTNTVTDSGVIDNTFDTFFLPSKNEEFLTVQATIDEGEPWTYWKRANNGTRPANYVNYAAPITYSVANHTSAQGVWLRSAIRGNSYYTWYVYSSGNVGDGSARSSLTVAPACVIC